MTAKKAKQGSEDYGKNLNETYLHQIAVLQTLSRNGKSPSEPRPYDINEIASLVGLTDEKEIQRYLFILEGQKFVTPQPEGDFTSKTWRITKNGLKLLRTIDRAAVVQ